MQRLMDAYMKIHQEKTVKLMVLTGWRKFVGKKTALEEGEREFRVRNRYFRRLIPFNRWKKALLYEQNVVKIGNLAIIRIKNDILTEVLRGWKLYKEYRLRKKCSAVHRNASILKQTVQIWRKTIEKQKVLTKICFEAGKQIKNQRLSTVFYTWFAAAGKKQKNWYSYTEVIKLRVKKVMKIWEKEVKWRGKKGEIAGKVTNFREIIRKKRGIRRLKAFCEGQSWVWNGEKIAKRKYSEKLKRIAFEKWTKKWEKGIKYTHLTENLTQKLGRKVIFSLFSVWKTAAEPKIRKIQSVKLIKTLFQRGNLRKGVKLWLEGVKNIVETDRKAENSHFRTLKTTTFQAFRILLEKLAGKRSKSQKITAIRTQIQQKSVLTRLKSNVFQQNSLKKQEDTANLYHIQRLQQLSIVAWVKYVALKQDLKGKSTVAALFRLETHGPAIISAWKTVTDSITVKKYGKNRALQHYAFIVLQKTINSLKNHANVSVKKRETTEIAKIAYKERLKLKYFNNLRSYRSAKVTEKGRRSHFSFQITENRQKTVLEKVFFALKQNQTENIDKISEIRFISGKLCAKSFLKTWKNTLISRQTEQKQIQTIEKTVQKREKRILFRFWRKSRAQNFALKKLKLRLKRKSLNRNLFEWKRQLAVKFIKMRGNLREKVIIFQNLKKYRENCTEAKRIFAKIGENLDFLFVKKLISKWRKTHHSWKKTKTIKNNQKTRKIRTFWSNWRKRIEINQKSVVFSLKLSKNLQNRIFSRWESALKHHFQLQSTLFSFFSALQTQWKRHSLSQWHETTRYLTIWERVNSQIIEPAGIRKVSGAFLGWKIVTEQRKMLKNVSNRYIEGRIYHRKRGIFDALNALREGRITAEKVVLRKENNQKAQKKKKMLKLWKLLITKRRILRDLRQMVVRKAARRRQKLYISLWLAAFRRISHIKTFKTAQISHLKAHFYAIWRKRYIETTHQSLFSRVISRHGAKTRKIALNLWYNAVTQQRNIDQKAASFLFRRQITLKKIALDRFSSIVHREKVHISVDFHLKMTRVKRVFRLFSLGCRLCQETAVKSTYATEHYRKRLLLSSLVAWRLWMQQRFEAHVEADGDYLKACQHHCTGLMGKAFVGWASETKERAYIQERSVLYAIFSAWKVNTRENLLLKKYLMECNLSERLMRSSRDVHDSSRSSVFATLRSLGSSGTTTREFAELSADRS